MRKSKQTTTNVHAVAIRPTKSKHAYDAASYPDDRKHTKHGNVQCVEQIPCVLSVEIKIIKR